MQRIILASTSPRRSEILAKTNLSFEVQDSGFEEYKDPTLSPETLVEQLAAGKAQAVAAREPDALVIGADTVVAHEGEVLGKPHTEERAREMLSRLSGSSHEIITGTTVAKGDDVYTFHARVAVHMKPFSETAAEAYVRTGEPLDKAGAYALQERAAVFIDHIEGDFFAAMGLPLARLAEVLENDFSVSVW